MNLGWLSFSPGYGASWYNQVSPKVDVPNSVTYLDQAPIFEWYVGWSGSKNKYQKDMCLTETALRAKNMLIDVGSIHARGDLYDQLTSTHVFALLMVRIFAGAPYDMQQMATCTIWIC